MEGIEKQRVQDSSPLTCAEDTYGGACRANAELNDEKETRMKMDRRMNEMGG